MSYSLGATAVLTAAQANKDMGWTKKKLRSYWDARAKMCQQMADEGECLAQVAKHVPVTLGGIGLGTTASDVTTILDVTAGLLRDPDGTLRARGPAIVNAADTHVVTPLMGRFGKAIAPYALKYLMPPIAILYVLTGISAYYSYKASQRMAPNRRRRRRRSRRRTSRR